MILQNLSVQDYNTERDKKDFLNRMLRNSSLNNCFNLNSQSLNTNSFDIHKNENESNQDIFLFIEISYIIPMSLYSEHMKESNKTKALV